LTSDSLALLSNIFNAMDPTPLSRLGRSVKNDMKTFIQIFWLGIFERVIDSAEVRVVFTIAIAKINNGDLSPDKSDFPSVYRHLTKCQAHHIIKLQ
jgi:hypothetical protein